MTIEAAAQKFAIGSTGLVAVFIFTASTLALTVAPQSFAPHKDQFQIAVVQTPLAMFTAIAVSIVTYVLGHAAVSALRRCLWKWFRLPSTA